MIRVLITGLSGTGKSTVVEELAARGYAAVDLDTDAYSEWVDVFDDSSTAGTPVEPDRDWMWREDRVQERLSREDTDRLFVSGTSVNMRRFLPRFDAVILLSAPAERIIERLQTRTNNPYGKRPHEIARVVDLMETVEPLLRNAADHEIDTRIPVEEVVAAILRVAQLTDRT